MISSKSLASTLTLPVLLAVLPSAQAEDWPNYRGPRHDGISTESLASTAWPASGPRQVWRTPTPKGFSSFTVADGRAFTLVTREVDGTPLETLVALDAATGRELWAHGLSLARWEGGGDRGTRDNSGGDGPRSTPTLHDGKVYVYDSKLVLKCLEASTGKVVWTRNIAEDHRGRPIHWGSAASPVIEGDLVLVAGGGKGEALLGIDRVSGRTVWKGQDDAATYATPVVTTLHGVRQAIFFTQEGLVSVRPTDGEVIWRQAFPFRVATAASPVVAGDIVYCSSGYGTGAGAYRISKEGDQFRSTELWRMPGKLENHWSTPVFHDGHLYGIFGHGKYGEAPLKCVQLATGEEKWSQAGFGPGNVTWVDGHLLVLGDAGQLVLVEATPDAYREKARADVLPGKCWSTPTYADGRIYVRSTQEGACFDLRPRLTAR